MLCDLTQEMILWMEVCSVALSVRYIPRKNILVEQLNHPDQVLPSVEQFKIELDKVIDTLI